MLKHVLYATAALALLALPGQAASVTIDGSVSTKCTLSITSGAILMGTLSTEATGIHAGGAHATSAVLTGAAMCNNTTNHVDIVAKPLVNTAVAATMPAVFTNRIDYTLASTLLPAGVTLDTASASDPDVGAESNDARNAFFWNETTGGAVTTDAGVKPAMAGTYEGSISVTVTPN